MCLTLGDTSIQLFLHWYTRPVVQASLHPNRKEMKENNSRLLTESGNLWIRLRVKGNHRTNEALVNKYKCKHLSEEVQM